MAFRGDFRRAYPSDDPRLQSKYEMVLEAAEGAFEMSILARAHKTVTKIQVSPHPSFHLPTSCICII